jgi:tetratricopeptide (TPR) repeat protein
VDFLSLLRYFRVFGAGVATLAHDGMAVEGGSAAAARFRAFVSYSHADTAIARRLQKRLETYRIPGRLAGRIPLPGATQGRVGPVFRDREDLPASADLSEAVREALAGSQALIVLCSPDAARSKWVAREIALFRALHPNAPVLAALIRGTPEESFPAEIRKGGTEPLAADFRRAGDGRKLAFLKVVAGILGLPLDELIQREGQRRQRRVIAVTAAAVAAMLVLATMTIFAVDARREAERQRIEAERQRGEAERLVEYMLSDLRPTLKAVGRLDVMGKVNRRAMDYYEDQGGLDRLSDDSLERRARVIGAIGEDDENSGDFRLARSRYEALYGTTRALLAKDPGNPARILAHARSENRLGLLAITEGRFDDAVPHLAATRRLLAAIEGWGRLKGEWLKLSAFAEGNSCATMLKRGKGGSATLDHCRRAVEHAERMVAGKPDDSSGSYDLVFHLLWLARAQLAAGEGEEARRTQARYLNLMRALIAREPDNMLWREQQMQLYTHHAEILRAHGDARAAEKFLAEARALSRRLAARDPRNAGWSNYKKRLEAQSARRE